MSNENATKKGSAYAEPSFVLKGKNMDLLKRAAQEFMQLMANEYYFEIARKNNQKEFILNFIPQDFHHIVGLHKLLDIGLVQTGRRDKVYYDILNGRIDVLDIKKSNYYEKIENRLKLVGQMKDIIDNDQMVFKYLKSGNLFSRIEANYLLEHAHKTDVIYIFLSERSKTGKGQIPLMCCRSFFPMNQLDYSMNQPSYTLLKKVKIDIATGDKTVQYDRGKILAQAKAAGSELECRSILQQLNEKKAQLAIKTVLEEKKNLQSGKQDREK